MGRLLINSVKKLIYYTCVGSNFHTMNSVNLCFNSTVKYLLSKLHLPRRHMHAHTHITLFSCFDDSKAHINFCHHLYCSAFQNHFYILLGINYCHILG